MSEYGKCTANTQFKFKEERASAVYELGRRITLQPHHETQGLNNFYSILKVTAQKSGQISVKQADIVLYSGK